MRRRCVTRSVEDDVRLFRDLKKKGQARRVETRWIKQIREGVLTLEELADKLECSVEEVSELLTDRANREGSLSTKNYGKLVPTYRQLFRYVLETGQLDLVFRYFELKGGT